MFEDILEMEGLIPTIIIYIIVGVMMWYLLLKIRTFTWSYRILFYIVLLPVSYLVVNYIKNK